MKDAPVIPMARTVPTRWNAYRERTLPMFAAVWKGHYRRRMALAVCCYNCGIGSTTSVASVFVSMGLVTTWEFNVLALRR